MSSPHSSTPHNCNHQPLNPSSPLRTLTLHTPELRTLLHQLILETESSIPLWSHGPFTTHSHSMFLTANGYMNSAAPPPSSLLSNALHPILNPENWHGGPYDLATFFEAAKPALQLASLWMSHNSWVQDWWVHLLYGRAELDEKGRIYLAPDVREQHAYYRALLHADMQRLAGRISFVFLPPASLHRGALACCMRSTRLFARDMAQRATFATAVSASFLESFTHDGGPVVVFSSEFYHLALAGRTEGGGNGSRIPGARRFQHHFHLAHTIVHELTHALMTIWHPWISHQIEPLHRLCDPFPESGKSWEAFVFGADVTTDHNKVPMSCMEFDHSFSPDHVSSAWGGGLLPLWTFIPESWTNRWFLKSTWERMDALREVLVAPSVRRDISVVAVTRVRGGRGECVILHNGREVSSDAHLLRHMRNYLDDNQSSNSSSQSLQSGAAPLSAVLIEMQSKGYYPQYADMQAPGLATALPPPTPASLLGDYMQRWRRDRALVFAVEDRRVPRGTVQGTQTQIQSSHHAPIPVPTSHSSTTPSPSPTNPYITLSHPRCTCPSCTQVSLDLIDMDRCECPMVSLDVGRELRSRGGRWRWKFGLSYANHES